VAECKDEGEVYGMEDGYRENSSFQGSQDGFMGAGGAQAMLLPQCVVFVLREAGCYLVQGIEAQRDAVTYSKNLFLLYQESLADNVDSEFEEWFRIHEEEESAVG
jgi:hypothetical protein